MLRLLAGQVVTPLVAQTASWSAVDIVAQILAGQLLTPLVAQTASWSAADERLSSLYKLHTDFWLSTRLGDSC